MATKSDPRAEMLAQVIAAPRSADIARLLDKDGKQLRDFVRKTLGVYVSNGGVLDERAKRYVFARFGDGIDAKTLAAAWTDGADAPTPA